MRATQGASKMLKSRASLNLSASLTISNLKEEEIDAEDFRPDQYRALLVGCSKYEEIRKKSSEMKEFNDMKGTEEVNTIQKMLKKCDFKEDDIKILTDPNADDCKKAIMELINACWENYLNREKTMVFFYYSGHSLIDADLQLLLNSSSNFLFPIQQMLSIVANLKDSYVVSFFDCTRKRMDLSQLIDKNHLYNTLPAETMALYESQNAFKSKDHINIISSYMCKPSVSLLAKPVNSVFYFKHIMLSKND